MTIAAKMQMLSEQSSMIRKMFEEGAKMKARYGADKVFDFSLGNPDVPPPAKFYEVLREVVEDTRPGVHGYMPNGGYLHVREAVAARLSAEQEVKLGGGDVLMTCGAAGALNLVMKTLLNPGDEVIVLTPFFVDYQNYVENYGGVVRLVATAPDFSLDLDAIEEALTEKTRVVLINSPNNPTGQIYSRASLEALGKLLDRAGERFCSAVYLVADEPYRRIVFDNHRVPPVMPVTTNAIVVSSYSKELSLPGERIGYLALHPDMAEKQKVADTLTLANRILGFINAPALMQRVIERCQDVHVDNSVYSRRRELFCQVLDAAGFTYERPKGAFYLFPKTPIDDAAFIRVLQQNRILAVPGRGFGAPGYMRLAFCVDETIITASADAFKQAMCEVQG
ncbi:MAG: aspartate aminotransferase [Deltaproteobacteria bacterium]|nr:MAG: aspartate aminotransferase [Deltaproteobacteria bacterium]